MGNNIITDKERYIVIPDTAIESINRRKEDNKSNGLVYCDKNNELHTIEFDVCAANFKAEHEASSGNCVGERKLDEYYFVFYTSGMKTKVVFKKMYAGIFRSRLLSGSRTKRFLDLQRIISETKYTTYDLS